MDAHTRASSDRWVLPDGASDASSSASDEDEELEPDAQNAGAMDAAMEGDAREPPSAPARKLKVKLNLKGSEGQVVCHVCRQPGHQAGFAGATYIDCINKPCYLCGKAGHSTATCPHRLAPELACTAAADVSTNSVLVQLRQREAQGCVPGTQSAPPPRPGRWAVDAAVLKLHARRCTCLEWHPTRDNIVLSGDKHGQIAVWDVDRVFERTVMPDINRWLTNALRFLPGGGSSGASCATTSYDGTVKLFDCELGVPTQTLVDGNPGGWASVVEEDKAGRWISFLGLDVLPGAGVVAAGDNKGRLYLLDPRCTGPPAALLQAHKKNTKVQSVCVHPLQERLLLTAGNDYHARLLDVRRLGGVPGDGGDKGKAPASEGPAAAPASCAEVMALPHPRVINSAYFSPSTGLKILTTCQDNRLRVWDNWHGSLATGEIAPSREIVHSQNFSRHLTPFKAEWMPGDPGERLCVVGRYISEDCGGVALHPVDFVDAATGALVGELIDPNLATICPVNKPHPRRELIVSGSSRSLYAWKPAEEEAEDEAGQRRSSVEARASGASAGAGSGALSQLPSRLHGSKNYMFFDADPGSAGKKRPKTQQRGATQAKKKGGASSSAPAPAKEEESDQGGSDSE